MQDKMLHLGKFSGINQCFPKSDKELLGIPKARQAGNPKAVSDTREGIFYCEIPQK
jgi:hypothetical protein